MASECVNVKQEPAEETENEAPSASGDQLITEFVNIKMEIDVEVPNISIKSDLSEPPSLPAERCDSWDVPLKDETSTFLGGVTVTVKEEVESEESDYDDPGSDECDDASIDQPTTSSFKDNIEGYEMAPNGYGYLCPICKKTYANPGNVQRHLLLHSRETVKCNECNGQFLNKIRLDRHIFNKHTTPKDRVYACDGCDKTFKSSSNLMQHKKVHLTIKPHQCSVCQRRFSFKTNLKKHQGRNRCKRATGEPIKCSECDKIFEKEYLLKSHLRKHATERPYSCDVCSTTFKYKSTLMRHKQLHKGDKPFNCPFCDKTFTHYGLLKPHLRVHTGEKPYQCPICLQTFAHKHNMQRHTLRHSRIKHLVCDICHKEFPKESRLKYHMKTHVNEKHFACQVCPKRFSHKQNVLRHYTRKHPGQTYSCPDTDASVALKVWDTFKSKYYDETEEILG